MSNEYRTGKEYAKVFRVIPHTAILGEFLRAWMCLACFTCRHLLTDHHPENEIEAASCFSKRYSFFTISDRFRSTYFLAYLLFSRLSFVSTFCNSYSEFLNFFGSFNNRIDKLLLNLIVSTRNKKSRKSSNTGTDRTQKKHDVPLVCISVKDCDRDEGQTADKEENHSEQKLFHFFLRGLISNLSVQTKFYSSLRRSLNNYWRLA